jgi:hypothetical protein
MAAATISRLLQPIDPARSEERTLEFLNLQYPSFAEVELEGTLRTITEDTGKEAETLRAKVSVELR